MPRPHVSPLMQAARPAHRIHERAPYFCRHSFCRCPSFGAGATQRALNGGPLPRRRFCGGNIWSDSLAAAGSDCGAAGRAGPLRDSFYRRHAAEFAHARIEVASARPCARRGFAANDARHCSTGPLRRRDLLGSRAFGRRHSQSDRSRFRRCNYRARRNPAAPA